LAVWFIAYTILLVNELGKRHTILLVSTFIYGFPAQLVLYVSDWTPVLGRWLSRIVSVLGPLLLTYLLTLPAGGAFRWFAMVHQFAFSSAILAYLGHYWFGLCYLFVVFCEFQWRVSGHTVTFVTNPTPVNLVGELRSMFADYKKELVLHVATENQHGWLAAARAGSEWFVLNWVLPRGQQIRQPGANYRRFHKQLGSRMHICNTRHENKDNHRCDNGTNGSELQSAFENCRRPGQHCPARARIPTALLSHVDYHTTVDELSAIVRSHTFLLHHDPDVANNVGQDFQSYQDASLSKRGGLLEMFIGGGQSYCHPYLQWATSEQQEEGSLVGKYGAFTWHRIGQLCGTEILYCYPNAGAYDATDPRNVHRPTPVYSRPGKWDVTPVKNVRGSDSPWFYDFDTRIPDAPGHLIGRLPRSFVDALICKCSGGTYSVRNNGAVTRIVDSSLRSSEHSNFQCRAALIDFVLHECTRRDLWDNANQGILYDKADVGFLYPYYLGMYAAQRWVLDIDLCQWATERLLRVCPRPLRRLGFVGRAVWFARYGPMLLLLWRKWRWVNMPAAAWVKPKTRAELLSEDEAGQPLPPGIVRTVNDTLKALGSRGMAVSGVPPSKPYESAEAVRRPRETPAPRTMLQRALDLLTGNAPDQPDGETFYDALPNTHEELIEMGVDAVGDRDPDPPPAVADSAPEGAALPVVAPDPVATSDAHSPGSFYHVETANRDGVPQVAWTIELRQDGRRVAYVFEDMRRSPDPVVLVPDDDDGVPHRYLYPGPAPLEGEIRHRSIRDVPVKHLVDSLKTHNMVDKKTLERVLNHVLKP